jgi:O-antigen/teichoic acid export membrane protein
MRGIGKQVLWLGIVTVLGGLFAYLNRRLFALNMTVEEYGLFYSVFALIFFFQYFRDLGMTESIVYHLNKFRAKNDVGSAKASILLGAAPQLVLGMAIAAILFFLKDFMVVHYFKTPLAEATYMLLLLVFIIEPLMVIMGSVLLGLEKTVQFRAIDFGRYLMIFATASVLFSHYPNYMVPAIAYLIGTIIVIMAYGLYFALTFRAHFKSRLSPSKELFGDMVSYAIPITFSTAGIIILQYSDILLLTYLKDAFAVGLYNIALPAIMVAVVLMTPIYIILFPRISRLFHRKETGEISKILSIAYNNILVLLLPISAVFFIFPAEIISLLFDADFLGATNTLRVFSITFIFMVLKDIGFAALAGLGLVRERSRIVYYAAAANIIFNLLLIPRYSATGAAIGTGIGFGIMALLGLIYIKKSYPIRISIPDQVKVIFASFLFALSLFIISNQLEAYHMLIRMIVSCSIASLIYLAALFALGIINRDKISFIKKSF